MTIKEINPANPLEPEHKELLVALFKQSNASTVIWSKDIYHQVFYKDQYFDISLEHSIIVSESKRIGQRFQVINTTKRLGEGSFGAVYPIEATLKMSNSNTLEIKIKKPEKSRIAKMIDLNNKHFFPTETIRRAWEEYYINRCAPHLHAKMPIETRRAVYLIMRRFPGRELFDIISEDMDKVKTLTIEQRFKITFSLLQAMQIQIIEAGIVHRDLKPENILVNLEANDSEYYPTAIIDFGLSKFADQEVKEGVGSPAYVSPEAIKQESTNVQSDIYALGRIIGLIWHMETTSYNYTSKDQEKILAFAIANDYSKLFNSSLKSLLPEPVKDQIQATIERMTTFNRGTLEHPLRYASIGEIVIAFKEAFALYRNPPITATASTVKPEPPRSSSHKMNINTMIKTPFKAVKTLSYKTGVNKVFQELKIGEQLLQKASAALSGTPKPSKEQALSHCSLEENKRLSQDNNTTNLPPEAH